MHCDKFNEEINATAERVEGNDHYNTGLWMNEGVWIRLKSIDSPSKTQSQSLSDLLDRVISM